MEERFGSVRQGSLSPFPEIHLSPRPLGLSNFFRSLSSTFLLPLILPPPSSSLSFSCKQSDLHLEKYKIGWKYWIFHSTNLSIRSRRKFVNGLGSFGVLFLAYLVSQLGRRILARYTLIIHHTPSPPLFSSPSLSHVHAETIYIRTCIHVVSNPLSIETCESFGARG